MARPSIIATGGLTSSSVQKLLKEVGALEAAELGARIPELPRGKFRGLRHNSARKMIETLIRAAQGTNLLVHYELRDNAVFRMSFRDAQRKAGEVLDIPIPVGIGMRYPLRPAELEGTLTQVQPPFITRGYIDILQSGKVRYSGTAETLGREISAGIEKLRPEKLGAGISDLKRRTRAVLESSIWGGAPEFMREADVLKSAIPLDVPASVLQAAQMQVRRYDPQAGKMLPLLQTFGLNDEFPLGKTGADLERAFGAIRQGRQFIRGLGIPYSDIAIKPEAGLKSFVSSFRLGEIVPFGKYADSTRQSYQQWMLRPLRVSMQEVGRPTVTTRAFERVRKALGDRTYQVPTDIFYTADPRIQEAVVGSEGGAIITHKLAKRLDYDLLIKREGQLIPSVERAGVGSAVITGMGDKLTISALAHRVIGRGNIGLITGPNRLLGNKYPFAVRKAVVSSVLEQLGTIPGYMFGGKAQTPTPLGRHKLQFIRDLAKALGEGAKVDVRTRSLATTGESAAGILSPQIMLGPNADLDVKAVENAVKRYNLGLKRLAGRYVPGGQSVQEFMATAEGWAPLQSVFTPDVVDIETGAGKIQQVSGIRIADWVGARAMQSLQEKTWAIGKGAAVPGVPGMYFTPKAGRGMKVRLRDVTNLRLYGSKEADAMADMLERAIVSSQLESKADIWKTFVPLMGHHKVPSGIKAATIRETLKQPLSPLTAPIARDLPGAGAYTAEMLAGTVFDPTSKYYKGVTVDLAKAARLPAEITGFKDEIAAAQIRVPSMEALGVRPTEILEGGVRKKVFYLQPHQRAAQTLIQAIHRGKDDVQDEVVRFLQQLAHYQTGKTGALRRMIEPHIGQSAYVRFVAQGTGEAAAVLGTELSPVSLAAANKVSALRVPSEAIARISEVDVRRMGAEALKEFNKTGPYAPKGYAWIQATRYPAQGPAHYSMVLAQMVRGAERRQLGAGMLGVSQAFATRQLGDFDADTAMLTVLTGRRGQQLSREFARKHTIPELIEMSGWLGGLSEKEQEVIRRGLPALSPDPKPAKFREYLRYVTDAKVRGELQEQEAIALSKIAEFYGTKQLTGATHTWMEEMRFFTRHTVGRDTRRAVAGVLSAVHQYGAILKGGEPVREAQGLIGLTNALTAEALRDEAKLQQAVPSVKAWIRGLRERALQGGQGEILGLRLGDVEGAAVGFLRAAQARGRWLNEGRLPVLKTITEGKRPTTPAESLRRLLGSLTSYYELGEERNREVAAKVNKKVAQLAGIDAAVEDMAAETALAPIAREAPNATANKALQEAGVAGRELPTPMVDRLMGWFRDPKVMNWKKAAVITGTALLGGAIVKNAFFPGYGPRDEAEAIPVQTAVPVPVRMPGLEAPVAASMFDRIPEMPAPVDGSSLMGPDRVNMGTRTPMPAVQMGRGTMVPGYAPNLAGTMFRDPPPAPVMLNQDRYNAKAAGISQPEQARVAAPPESLASSYRIWATPPEGGLDTQEFARRTGIEAMVTMEQAEDSEYDIRSAIDEMDGSSFL